MTERVTQYKTATTSLHQILLCHRVQTFTFHRGWEQHLPASTAPSQEKDFSYLSTAGCHIKEHREGRMCLNSMEVYLWLKYVMCAGWNRMDSSLTGESLAKKEGFKAVGFLRIKVHDWALRCFSSLNARVCVCVCVIGKTSGQQGEKVDSDVFRCRLLKPKSREILIHTVISTSEVQSRGVF